MKGRIIHIVIFLSVITLFISHVDAQVYPVQTVVNIMPPGSAYLQDYANETPSRFQLSINLLDENQSDLDILLSLSIEGNGVSLNTDPNILSEPINLKSGPNLFTGKDLEQYFDPRNMNISGINPQTLLNGGPLPEGMYTICVEVRDYLRRDKVLNQNNCAMLIVQLNSPPDIISPKCGSTVTYTEQQNILFQWHDNHDPSIHAEYKIKLVEVPEGLNPDQAILASETPILNDYSTTMKMLHYDGTFPELDYGHTYAVRIQVEDMQNQVDFINEGKSEVCSFTYGNDSLGHIDLLQPEMDAAIDAVDLPPFEWNGINNMESGDQVYYKLSIVQIGNEQTAEVAMQNNFPVYVQKSEIVTQFGKWNMITVTELNTESEFAWQVQAYIDENVVAESNIGKFKTTSFINGFTAARNEIKITKLDNDNLDALAGTGLVQLKSDGEWYKINFEDLEIEKFGRDYILKHGLIESELEEKYVIKLETTLEGSMTFHASHIVIDSEDKKLRGRVIWDYPLASNSSEGPKKFYTKEHELLYNSDQLQGTLAFAQDHVDLMDPASFSVIYDSTSTVDIAISSVTVSLDGKLKLPDLFNDETRVEIPFSDVTSCKYFVMDTKKDVVSIKLHDALNLSVSPKEGIIDLDRDKSPSRLSENPDWMGFYFSETDFIFNDIRDTSNQYDIIDDYKIECSTSDEKVSKFWIGDDGLDIDFSHEITASTPITFNTFGGDFKEFQFVMENSIVQNGYFKGKVSIPLFEDRHFAYTIPFHKEGLSTGYLDESLEGLSYDYGDEDAPNFIRMKVHQAVFRDRTYLDFNVNLDFVNLQITSKSGNRGINISDLYLHGSGDATIAGSRRKVGLDEEHNGFVSEKYKLQADSIGIKIENGKYGFVLRFHIPMGENVSGDDGVPFADITGGEIEEEQNEEESENYVKGGFHVPKLSLNFGGMILKLEKLELREDEEWGKCFEAEGAIHKTGMFPTGKAFSMNFHCVLGKKEFFYAYIDLAAGSIDFDAMENDPLLKGYYSRSFVEHGTNPFDDKDLFDAIPLKGVAFKLYINMLKEKEAEEYEVVPHHGGYGGGGALTLRVKQSGENFIDVSGGVEFIIDNGKLRYLSGFISGHVNKENVIDATVKGSFYVDWSIEEWAATVSIEVEDPFCMEGEAGIENAWGKDEWHLKLGSLEEPVEIFPYPESHCTGIAALFFFQYNPGIIEAGFGIKVQFKAKSGWIGLGDLGSVRGSIVSYLSGMAYGSYFWNSERSGIGTIGVDLHLGIRISLEYKFLSDTPSGAVDFINITAHANGHVDFPQDDSNVCTLYLGVDGSGTILGFSIEFSWEDSWEAENPFEEKS